MKVEEDAHIGLDAVYMAIEIGGDAISTGDEPLLRVPGHEQLL